MTVIHDVPWLSANHPVKGEARDVMYIKHAIISEEMADVQKRVGTTAAKKTRPTLDELSPQIACKCKGRVGSWLL